jgi:CHAD domain-containing protein
MKTSALTQYLLYELYHARVVLHSLKYEGKEVQLHELRITLRRIHSLVKLFMDDFTPFHKALKKALKATNPIRELDVLLASLSPSKCPKLFKQLSNLRQEAFKTLFTSKYTLHLLLVLDHCADFFSQTDSHHIAEILTQRVLTHYQDCLNSYSLLKGDETPSTLHHLRIKFKDVRYGFEFLEISEIHPCREIILQCKKQQNTLGAIQDAVNQVKWLRKFYQKYPSSEAKNVLAKRKRSLEKLKSTVLINVQKNR